MIEKEYKTNKQSRDYSINYYYKNKDSILNKRKKYNQKNKKKIKLRRHNHYLINKDEYKRKHKLYREKNKKLISKEQRKKRLPKINKLTEEQKKQNILNYRIKNKEIIITKERLRRQNSYDFRIACNMRSRLRIFLKGNKIIKSNKTFNYIGCNKEELKKYLENKFKNGMSWNNYGEWEIDHIIPFKYFKDNGGITEENLYKVMHYTNLQPLWKSENRKKNGKY